MNHQHALYVGAVLGVAMRHGIPLEPLIDEHGDYTNELALRLPTVTLTVVVPPPPDDWRLDDWLP